MNIREDDLMLVAMAVTRRAFETEDVELMYALERIADAMRRPGNVLVERDYGPSKVLEQAGEFILEMEEKYPELKGES